MIEVHSRVYLVAAEPMFFGKLVGRDQLKFFAIARPSVEVIPAVAFRRDQHVGKSLTVSIAVKPGVLRNGAEDCAGLKLVTIG